MNRQTDIQTNSHTHTHSHTYISARTSTKINILVCDNFNPFASQRTVPAPSKLLSGDRDDWCLVWGPIVLRDWMLRKWDYNSGTILMIASFLL